MEAQGPIVPTSSSALYNPKGYPRLLQSSLGSSGLRSLPSLKDARGLEALYSSQ